MTKTRRQFIKNTTQVGLSLSLAPTSWISQKAELERVPRASHPMKILILGGTSFLGPHHIAYALNRGHEISIFTRGKTKPSIYKELFSQVEHLVGDRANDLDALRNRSWDAVIDNSGHRVSWAKDTAELLRDQVGSYLYTSSTGVYYPYRSAYVKEDTRLVYDIPADVEGYHKAEYEYGTMKARSEKVVQDTFGSRAIIVRPTYMFGPADRTDRLIYWPVRLSIGGDVLIPGKPTDPVQYIDVRDVAGYMIRQIELSNGGVSNVVGPISAQTMQGFVHGVHACFGTAITLHQIPDYDWLLNQYDIHDMVPWILPLGDLKGSSLIDNSKALSQGLTIRPLADSINDTYAWWMSAAVSEERRDQLVNGESSIMNKEAEILKAYQKR